jgi:hypothetical protein
MRKYLVTPEERKHIACFMSHTGPYDATVRKVLSAWRRNSISIKGDVELLDALEAKRK